MLLRLLSSSQKHCTCLTIDWFSTAQLTSSLRHRLISQLLLLVVWLFPGQIRSAACSLQHVQDVPQASSQDTSQQDCLLIRRAPNLSPKLSHEKLSEAEFVLQHTSPLQMLSVAL